MTSNKISLVIGLILLYFSISSCYKSINLIKNGFRTTGEVIAFKDRSGKNSRIYAPVFIFYDPLNISHTYESNKYSNPPDFIIGDKINLVYNPENTDEVKPFSYWGLFTGTIILLILAMPFLIISGGFFLYSRTVK